MRNRQVLLYFAWSRRAEIDAPLTTIDDRFPAIFELRRLLYPTLEALADPAQVDQGIAGFIDHLQKPNFAAFVQQTATQTARPVIQVEREVDDGTRTLLDDTLLAGVDTIVVISFDSFRAQQSAEPAEIAAVRRFLDHPDHVIFVCPHHDIGEVTDAATETRIARQTAEYLHHGDHAIPPRQGFGWFARTLLAGLDVPVDNRFGLRPALNPDGSPAPIDLDRSLDRLQLLDGVVTFNHHAHLPQLERVGQSVTRLDVLARQRIDLSAPPHPFTREGRDRFDALLQSQATTFAGTLLVSDTTLFSSTVGGIDDLRRLWSNIVQRPARG